MFPCNDHRGCIPFKKEVCADWEYGLVFAFTDPNRSLNGGVLSFGTMGSEVAANKHLLGGLRLGHRAQHGFFAFHGLAVLPFGDSETGTLSMLPEKKVVLLDLLEKAWVYVALDPRKEGVLLPDQLRKQPRLTLQYGYNMPMPIADLQIDDEGIRATLSFSRSPFATFIPWSAVFAIYDDDRRGLLWEENLPKDIDAEPPAPQPEPPKPVKKPRPSHLKLVP